MARTGASNVCRSVASVPFFGGGGRFGRSWGMRQSLGAPVPTRLCWGARRARAVLAVAPSNTMRAACGELAAPVLIVPIKMCINPLFGRAMVPRLWRKGGAKGCTQNGLLLKLFHARALQGSSGRLKEPLRDASRTCMHHSSRGYCRSPQGPIASRRHCATQFASLHQIRADNESLCHLPIARIANCSEKEV